jgi:hypothetical protein
MRIDPMNLLIVLVLAVNLALIVFSARNCSARRERSPVPPKAASVAPEPQKEESGPETGSVRPEERKKEPVQIEVLNGCGAPKIADKFMSYLRGKGFDVVKTGNYENFNVPKTLVIDRKGNFKNAVRLANALGLKKTDVISEVHEMFMVEATVVLGKDFRTLACWKSMERSRAKK